MHVLLNPFGSAGDVHPFVGLGLRLRQRGHRVVFLVNAYFRPLIESHGFEAVDLGTAEQMQEAMNHPDLWHPTRALRVVTEGILLAVPMVFNAIAERFQPGATVVVTSSLGFGARIAEEKLGVPTATIHLQPSVLRSVHEMPVLPGLERPEHLPRFVKRLMYWAMDRLIIDRLLAPGLNAFRARLGLPPVQRLFDEWGRSNSLQIGLFPEWFATPQPDWPRSFLQTGFPLYDEADVSPMPAEVAAFLENGTPPIVFTPGSAMTQGRDFFEVSVDVCRRLGRRALFLTRFADQIPHPLPPEILHASYVPFSRVFPRAAAVVHHGGIGTTAQALAAGVPQLIRPLAHDQFDNAARLRRLGVARSLRPRHYDSRRASNVLSELVESPKINASARSLTRYFSGVDPLADTCLALESLQNHPWADQLPS